MARKSLTYTVTADGRDLGKVFLLTEKSAFDAERWATRALLALARSGVNLPDGIDGMGWAGVAVVGVQAFAAVSYEDLSPLMDEMIECVQIVPDPRTPGMTRSIYADGDVEEVQTLLELRREVLKLHMDFSTVAALFKPKAATGTESDISTIPTPPESSE